MTKEAKNNLQGLLRVLDGIISDPNRRSLILAELEKSKQNQICQQILQAK
jgi:hypothetical protein